jgi:hypothetical protein
MTRTFAIIKTHFPNPIANIVHGYLLPYSNTDKAIIRSEYVELYQYVYEWNIGLAGACRNGDYDTAKFMIEHGANDWAMGLYNAYIGNHRKLIDLMITNGADINYAKSLAVFRCDNYEFAHAILEINCNHTRACDEDEDGCRSGYCKFASAMVEVDGTRNWDSDFENACRGGHRKIIDHAIACGIVAWDWGLYGACRGGHREIVDLMIANGADNWEIGLEGACRGGHREIVDLMIARGASNWNDGFATACRGGRYEIAKLMIAYGANDWNRGMCNACYGGHIKLVKLMIAYGADDWNDGLLAANETCSRDVINLMIELGANSVQHRICIYSISEHRKILGELIEHEI